MATRATGDGAGGRAWRGTARPIVVLVTRAVSPPERPGVPGPGSPRGGTGEREPRPGPLSLPAGSPGRRESWHAATRRRHRQPHTERFHRHDHLALARTGPLGRRGHHRPDRRGHPPLPAPRPDAQHRRPGVVRLHPAGRPGPARPARPGDLRHRLRPVPGRPDVPAPGALADPGPGRRPDRPRRPPRGDRRPRPGDGVDLRRRDRGLRPHPARLAHARPVLAAVDARHVLHRHPDRDRRPLDGRSRASGRWSPRAGRSSPSRR